MLDQSQRQTILTLREAGHGIRAIARALGISRIAVKRVLASGDARPPPLERAEKADAHRDDILALYAQCKGNLVRVHEELAVVPVGGEQATSGRPCELLATLPCRAAAKASGDGGVRTLNRRTFASPLIARMTKAA